MPSLISQLRGQREATSVSKETEVSIPWETYKKLLLLGPISIWCLWLAGSVVWMIVAMERHGWWHWVRYQWWPWMARWWGIPLFVCLLWWASAPTWATIYRYLIETWIKNPPLYGEWPAENGAWHPLVNWRRRRIEKARLDETYW